MAATKEQERKALAQISSIIEKLGPDSYIGVAFEGCIQDAVENIENDWACSWKQRAEAMDKELDTRAAGILNLQEELKKQRERADAAEARYNELKATLLTWDDLDDFATMLKDSIYECEKNMEQAAANIVALADTPTDIAFQNAANIHRRAQQKKQYAAAILARVNRAKGRD